MISMRWTRLAVAADKRLNPHRLSTDNLTPGQSESQLSSPISSLAIQSYYPGNEIEPGDFSLKPIVHRL